MHPLTSTIPTPFQTYGPSTVSPTTSSPTTAAPATLAPATTAPSASPTAVPTLQPPLAWNATLEDTARSITVTLSRAADPSTPSDCASVFTSATVSELGTAASCLWLNALQLQVTLGADFSVVPGSALTVRGGVLYGPGETVSAPTHIVSVAAPEKPIPVSISAVGQATIGNCDLRFRVATASSGSAGKPLNYVWRFYKSTPASSSSFRVQMDDYLSRYNLSSVIELSAANFTVGTQYWLNVTATNWLGSVATVDVSFKRVADAQPSLLLPGPTTLSVQRSAALQIRTQVRAPNCTSHSAPSLTTRAIWKQTMGTAVAIPNPTSVYLYVPAFTLSSGVEYAFQIYVWTTDLGGQTVGSLNQTFTVTVQDEPVIASIAGGSLRAVSVARGSWLVFDASGSLDPMYPTTKLNFSWTVAPGPVPLTNASTAVVNGSKIFVSASLLSSSTAYTITVRVTGANNRSSVATQEVITSAVSIPSVSVSASFTGKYNPNEKLVLTGAIDSAVSMPISLQWTCDSLNFNLSDRRLLRSETTNFQLVIAAGALPSGPTYRFRFTVTDSLSGVGYSTLAVTVNSPPLLGTCGASPSSGVALDTKFHLSCSGWTDEDTPLEYQFQLTSTGLALCGFRLLSYYDTVLPAGNLLVRSVIRDSHGGVTSSPFNVSVAQRPQLILSSTESELNERLAEGDSQSFAVLCAGTAAYLKESSSVSSSVSTSTRKDLLASIETMRNSSVASVSGVVASLVEAVTDYGDPTEMSEPASQEPAIDLLATVAGSTEALSNDAIVASATAVANLVSSAASTNGSSTVSASESIESVLSSLSTKLTESSAVGEDAEVVQARESAQRPVSVEITGQVVEASELGQTSLSSSSGTLVSFPPLPSNVSSTESLRVSAVSVQGNSLYPKSLSVEDISGSSTVVQGGLVSIQVRNATGGSLKIYTNETHPFQFAIPRGNQSEIAGAPADSVSYHLCEYWDVVSRTWQRDGVRAYGVQSDGTVLCNSTHLTAFSSSTEFRIRVNTFSNEDLSAAAFSPGSNPMMILIICLFSAFAIAYPFARTFDEKIKRQDHDRRKEVHFWRETNRVHQEHFKERTRERFSDVSKWAVRRRHPWISLAYRPEGDYMTTQKRLMILLVLLLNMMVVCTLLIGNDQALPFLQSIAANALVACLFSFPVPYVFAKLFTRKTPPEFRMKLDRSAVSGTCVGYTMMIIGICAGLDSIDEAGEEHDAGDAEDVDDGGDGGDEDAGGDEQEARARENEGEEDKNNEDEKDREREKKILEQLQRETDAISAVSVVGAAAAIGNQFGTEMAFKYERNRRRKRRARMNASRASRRQSLSEINSTMGSTAGSLRSLSEYADSKGSGSSVALVAGDFRRPKSRRRRRGSYVAHWEGSSRSSKRTGARQYTHAALRTHEWTREDKIGIGLLCVVAVGATFVLAMLSWTSKESIGEAVQGSAVSIAQDIFARLILILLTEYLLVAPLHTCCCCCLCCCGAASVAVGPAAPAHFAASGHRTIKFKADKETFAFNDELVVVELYGQARKRGVKEGWTVVAVNGEKVKTGRETRKLLARAHCTASTFEVTFSRGSDRAGGYELRTDAVASDTATTDDGRSPQSRHPSAIGGDLDAKPGRRGEVRSQLADKRVKQGEIDQKEPSQAAIRGTQTRWTSGHDGRSPQPRHPSAIGADLDANPVRRGKARTRIADEGVEQGETEHKELNRAAIRGMQTLWTSMDSDGHHVMDMLDSLQNLVSSKTKHEIAAIASV